MWMWTAQVGFKGFNLGCLMNCSGFVSLPLANHWRAILHLHWKKKCALDSGGDFRVLKRNLRT